jgi:hypothetical protein
MRMRISKLTRLMNVFARNRENPCAALDLHPAYHSLCRIRRSLRVTPAMEAGIAGRLRSIHELLSL